MLICNTIYDIITHNNKINNKVINENDGQNLIFNNNWCSFLITEKVHAEIPLHEFSFTVSLYIQYSLGLYFILIDKELPCGLYHPSFCVPLHYTLHNTNHCHNPNIYILRHYCREHTTAALVKSFDPCLHRSLMADV